ncbi:MAG: radical SAM protein, partial [Acinetobacter sp.]
YIYDKALNLDPLTFEQAFTLYNTAPTSQLSYIAHCIRMLKKPGNIVTWQIDRNINITNSCISGCKFCNFHCRPSEHEKIFLTDIDEYSKKIGETLALGGDQILLQGGLHPDLDINYYETLFKELKRRFRAIKLHALGPPEIFHIARISGITVTQTLSRLIDAGLESLPGAGAEILDNEVRKRISPAKCSADQWLDVMRIAHRMGLATSATMMYGHVETPKHRVQHLLKIRDLQNECPSGNYGFLAFIPWIFCSKGTALASEMAKTDTTITNTSDTTQQQFSSLEYLRIIAMSRILLNNIDNIQTSWLTVGVPTAQLSLYGGANDMGSIMIEENVVSSAGATNSLDAHAMRDVIIQAGFTPRLRDQKYNFREL